MIVSETVSTALGTALVGLALLVVAFVTSGILDLFRRPRCTVLVFDDGSAVDLEVEVVDDDGELLRAATCPRDQGPELAQRWAKELHAEDVVSLRRRADWEGHAMSDSSSRAIYQAIIARLFVDLVVAIVVIVVIVSLLVWKIERLAAGQRSAERGVIDGH